ncbi:hypothetical protein BIS44_2872 [Mycobacterium tuberculosis variant bovis BCG]|nr:hypothetical protein BIS44_2872 [Mycobacterium tuberculosis variant bovis BCG]
MCSAALAADRRITGQAVGSSHAGEAPRSGINSAPDGR